MAEESSGVSDGIVEKSRRHSGDRPGHSGSLVAIGLLDAEEPTASKRTILSLMSTKACRSS